MRNGSRVIKIRKISNEQAKKEILQFINDRKKADTFEIVNELRLDIDVAIKALKELWKDGKVK